jgi:hypothetical protein
VLLLQLLLITSNYSVFSCTHFVRILLASLYEPQCSYLLLFLQFSSVFFS